MKKYIKISKLLLKKFAKEKEGSGILEFVIILAVLSVSIALISPAVSDQLAKMFNNQSQDITFGGEKGDTPITTTPQANSLPAIDSSTSTATQKKYLLKFDGTTYVQLPDSLMNFGSGSSNITLEGWFNSGTGNMSIFGKNGSLPNENQLIFGLYNNTYNVSDGFSSLNSTYTPIRNQKVHIAFVINNNVLTVYENGNPVWTQTISSRTRFSNELAPHLGMETDNGITTPTDFFIGYMYEVRLYNRALSSAEILQNKSGSSTRTGLVAEYLFNDGPGNIVSDHSGNGNNGTVIGNPFWEIQ